MKSAAIYARVSTTNQADNGTSLQSQVGACQKYAEQNGYTVTTVFKESKSGSNLERPQLDQMREMARKGEIQAVIFYALDRLSRDETDTLILAREWQRNGIEMKCATVNLEDTLQGQFMLSMLAAVGKLENADRLERFMRGKRQTVRNGKVLKPRNALLGYNYRDGMYEVNEAEAYWVRRIFHWYCNEGLSLLAITHRLQQDGAPNKQGGTWAPITVRKVLGNEAYTGDYYWGKNAHKRNTTAKLRPRSEWIGPVSIPPIVSREFYERAQERFEYNKVNCRRRCNTDYLLRGLMVCELCGRRLFGDKAVRKTGTYKYYVCTNKQGQVPVGDRCQAARVNGWQAEEKVWNWVVTRLSNPDLLMELLQSDDADRAQRERDESDMRSLLAEQADLQREENKIIELFTKDAISLDKFKERNQLISDRGTGVESRIIEIEQRQAARSLAVQDARDAIELCKTIQRNLPKSGQILSYEEKRALLDAFHVKVTAKADGDVRVTGIISEDLLALAAMSPMDTTDSDIIGHELRSDRGSDRRWQDEPGESAGATPEHAPDAGADRRGGSYGQSKAAA